MSEIWKKRRVSSGENNWTEFLHSGEKFRAQMASSLVSDWSESSTDRVLSSFSEILATSAMTTTGERTQGRGDIRRLSVPDWGSMIIRRGIRGGLAAKLFGAWYLRLPNGPYRVFQELELLAEVAGFGVAVPEPVGAMIRRGASPLLYCSLLATREIPDAENLFVRARKGAECSELCQAVEAAGREARKLLQIGVFHPDLHLGNILQAAGRVLLIDFDNSKRFSPSPELRASFQDRLVSRFHRFCEKYGIYPKPLTASFRHGLELESKVEAESKSL